MTLSRPSRLWVGSLCMNGLSVWWHDWHLGHWRGMVLYSPQHGYGRYTTARALRSAGAGSCNVEAVRRVALSGRRLSTKAAQVWNSLTRNLPEMWSLGLLKAQLRQWLLQEVSGEFWGMGTSGGRGSWECG